MKKILFATAAIMAAMTACNKEEVNVVETPAASEAKVWVEFTAGVATKAALVEGDETHSIVWEENDAISVNREIISTTESGAKVTFAGEVTEGFLAADNYSAVYPASAGKDFNEITVKAEQTAVAEGFDDIVAVAYSADRSLQFKHVTSLIKFQVPSDFEVNTVTFSADQDLAGKVSVAMSAENDTPTITVKEGVKTVTLTGSFEADKDYYVAVLPGEKTNLTVRFNGYLSKNWTSTVNIKQGHVANVKVLPAPQTSSVELRGDSPLDWNNGTKFYKDVDYDILKNVSLIASQGFKIYNGTKWLAANGNLTLGTWTMLYEGPDNMKLAAGSYDIYVSKTSKTIYVVKAGSAAPELIVPKTDHVYLQPSLNWFADNAKFVAWIWKDNGSGKAYKFKESSVKGLYELNVTGCNKIIIIRMDPSTSVTDGSTNWPGDGWAKTGNLSINGNLYTVVNWLEATSEFSTVTTLL